MLVTYLTNGYKRFAPIHKLDPLNGINLEDISLTKFRAINAKNISTIKTETILNRFIYSTIYFTLDEIRTSIEQHNMKEIATEKMFIHS